MRIQSKGAQAKISGFAWIAATRSTQGRNTMSPDRPGTEWPSKARELVIDRAIIWVIRELAVQILIHVLSDKPLP